MRRPEVLQLSTRTVRDYEQRGEIEGRIIGGRWRFRRADLDREWDFAGKDNHEDYTGERRKQGRGTNGHFLGFRARFNCESIPVIPAWLARANLNDPREIPYLFVWKDRWGEVNEAVRLARCSVRMLDGFVELKRPSLIWQMLPRIGGRSSCFAPSDTPRRFVYGWEWDNFSGRSNCAGSTVWCCRSCNQSRYSSEGGYLRPAYRRLDQLGAMLRASWGNLRAPSFGFLTCSPHRKRRRKRACALFLNAPHGARLWVGSCYASNGQIEGRGPAGLKVIPFPCFCQIPDPPPVGSRGAHHAAQRPTGHPLPHHLLTCS